MSDTFNPGDGWREVEQDEWYSSKTESLALEKGTHDKAARYWVRVPPVSPLPTAPWTTFRTTHTSGGTATWLRHPNGTLLAVHSGEFWHEDPKDIIDWEPVSEPRAATAKAVLAEARAYVFQALGEDVDFGHIARNHGVES